MIERVDSRKLIQRSVLDLLNDHSIQDISVKQITANCGITSRTFYNHFKDKYEVVSSIYLNYMRPYLSSNLEEWYSHLSSFAIEHTAFLKNTLIYNGQNSIEETILTLEWEKLMRHIKPEVLKNPDELVRTKYAIEYMLYGNIGSLLNFTVYKRNSFSPEVYANGNADVWSVMVEHIPPIIRKNLSIDVQTM
ncbi:MAG: TetR/AcrR family transcriptional regulator [Lachnospiraceae bacterium]|nr:TetR/AcrR family transcriptional regulator [Lachnospiraceae bacterium]